MGLTYRESGVDIDKGDRFVEAIKRKLPPKDQGNIGLFGGLFDISALGYKNPVLVASTDGIGTKLLVAKEAGRFDTIGIDLVAMSVNDIITSGATPLFFLDYYATGKLDVDVAEQVVKGIVEGCSQSRCVLLGGETAEMPGFYGGEEFSSSFPFFFFPSSFSSFFAHPLSLPLSLQPRQTPEGDYDVAGFAVGAVKKSEVIDGSRIAAGDVLVALPSTGVHSNGFSLARAVVEAAGARLAAPVPWSSLDASDKRSLGGALLTPTR